MNRPAGVPDSLYPFEGRRFDLHGLGYHYLDEGSGEPVIMVHGNPTWSLYYRRLVLAVRESRRAIVPDHIGMGLSDKPDDAVYDYTLSRRVADFDAFLDHLALDRPLTLIAHDWGGMIAMCWAVRNPDRVARIVLMNTAAFPLPDHMRLPIALWFVRNTRMAPWLVRRFNLFSHGATWLAPAKRMSRELRRAYRAPYDTPANRIATLRFVQDIPLGPDDPAHAPVSETEAGLRLFHETPIQLIWGMRDFVFRPEVLEIFEKIWPHAEVHRIADAGHYVLEDAGPEVVERIADFLERHPA